MYFLNLFKLNMFHLKLIRGLSATTRSPSSTFLLKIKIIVGQGQSLSYHVTIETVPCKYKPLAFIFKNWQPYYSRSENGLNFYSKSKAFNLFCWYLQSTLCSVQAFFWHSGPQKAAMPHLHHSTVVCQPYVNHVSTIHQPYINHMSTICQPYVNHTSTICQPYVNHMSTTCQG